MEAVTAVDVDADAECDGVDIRDGRGGRLLGKSKCRAHRSTRKTDRLDIRLRQIEKRMFFLVFPGKTRSSRSKNSRD